MLLVIVINKIQEFFIHLFLMNRSAIIRYFTRKLKKKTSDSEFSYVEVWFTDQNSKPPEIGDKISIALVIN